MVSKYRVKILCPWHETGTSGFDTALDAYEYLAEMGEISRDDVIRVEIERYEAERSD